MTLITPVFLVVVMWGVTGLAMTGLGLAVRRAFGLKVDTPDSVVAAAFVGLGCILAFLQMWHFAAPVNDMAFFLVMTGGACGLLWNSAGLCRVLRANVRPACAVGVLMLCSAVWLASQSTTQPRFFDGGFYYLSAIRWNYTYPIVPGLGNLHDRLAFNSSHFLYASMLDIGPFTRKAHHLVTGSLILPALLRAFSSLWRVFVSRDTRATTLFEALCLAPLVLLGGGDYVSSPSPDVGVYLLGMVVGSELLKKVSLLRPPGYGRQAGVGCQAATGGETTDDGRRTTTGREAAYSVFVIGFLSAVGVTVKLSFLAFGITATAVGAWALLAGSWTRGDKRETANEDVSGLGCSMFDVRCWKFKSDVHRKAMAWLTVAAIVVGVPWLARGIILSGYLAYPLAFTALPVEWRIPVETAHEQARFIRHYARTFGRAAAGSSEGLRWMWPWLNQLMRDRYDVWVPVFIGAVLSPLLWLIRKNRECSASRCRSMLPVLIVCGVSVAFWLIAGPAPRFAGFTFWLFGLSALAVSILRFDPVTLRCVVLAVAVVLFSQNADLVDCVLEWQRDPGPAKTVKMTAMTTDSGLDVYVPVGGKRLRCWDSTLPCTPYGLFNPALRLRAPGDMGKGFVVANGDRDE